MFSIPIKTPQEIERMRDVCRVTAEILDALEGFIRPGVSTEDIDAHVHRLMLELGACPSTLNYKGYPKSVCTSVNDVVCHGIPNADLILAKGDIVNVDITSFKDGFHGDASRMFMVGGEDACTTEARTLVHVAEEALYAGISVIRPGAHFGDIGAAILHCIESTGRTYGIVWEYGGHGIGRDLHEPPNVSHIGTAGSGDEIRPGMTFTVEPMINAGSCETVLSKTDGWTVRTADGSLSAQWEHTILVTSSGHEILTKSFLR